MKTAVVPTEMPLPVAPEFEPQKPPRFPPSPELGKQLDEMTEEERIEREKQAELARQQTLQTRD